MNVPGCLVVLSLILLMKLKGTCSMKCYECYSYTYSKEPCVVEDDMGGNFCAIGVWADGELNLSVADCYLFVFWNKLIKQKKGTKRTK